MSLLGHRGWTPAASWIAALWTQGVGLAVLGVLHEVLRESRGDPAPSFDVVGLILADPQPFFIAAGAYGVTAVFFGLALPTPDAQAHEGPLARLALAFFRLLPRPRPWVRAAASLLTLAPYAVFGGGFWELGLGAVLFLLASTARRQPVGLAITFADRLGPLCLCALVASQVWPWRSRPDIAGVLGLAMTWFAQALFLRHVAARQWAAVVALGRGRPADIPLDDYVSETERIAAPAAAPSMDSGGAVLMDSGTFRVDATRMLENLRERQLEEPEDFILAWLRCAVASGAGVIALKPSLRRLRLEFDGRPFSPAQMSDPYRALLDSEAEDAQRGAQFAYGLLAALRLKPAAIWLVSGEGAARSRTVLAARDTEEHPPAAEPSTGTLVEVRFGGLAGFLRPLLAARRAASAFGHGAARLRIRGWDVPGLLGEDFQRHSHDGWDFGWRPLPGAEQSRVRVYHLGVFVEEFDERIEHDHQVEAVVSNPLLRLSLSQSSAVRDERFHNGLRLLRQAVVGAPWDRR